MQTYVDTGYYNKSQELEIKILNLCFQSCY